MDAMQILGPMVLFLLMSVVGLELTVDDFRRVARRPAAVLGGTAGQILLLPLMTWGVVQAFELDPAFGVGAVLVAVSPGAGISNVLVALGRANVALSVSLTAFSSVLAVLTLPAFASLGVRFFLDDAGAVEVPVLSLVAQLVFVLALPITGGMTLRAWRPHWADRLGPPLRRGTFVFILVVFVASFFLVEVEQVEMMGSDRALVAAAVWTVCAMGLGWGTARALGLAPEDRFTFLIEFSARNVAVSAIVALSGLGRLDLTIFSGVYTAAGYPLAMLATFIWTRRLARADGS